MKITLENIQHNNHHVYKRYPFLSKILFIDGKSVLCIIDNVHAKTISIYTFEHFDNDFKDNLYKHASDWYKSGHKIPISVYFDANNLKKYVEDVSKLVYIKAVKQIDGYIFSYPQFENITNKLTLSEGTL